MAEIEATGPADEPSFEDPLEGRIAWWPVRQGGYRFRSLRLVSWRRGRLDLESTWWMRAASLVVALPGLALAGLLIWRGDRLELREILLLSLIAGLLLALAGSILYASPRVRFDRARGLVTRGRLAILAPAERIPFAEVHALQLLRESCPTKHGSFYSYELNLVLHSGRRVNLADHGDLDYLRENARRLRAFLKIPIWDAADADAPVRPRTRGETLRLGAGLTAWACVMAVVVAWLLTRVPLARSSYGPDMVGTANWLVSVLQFALWIVLIVVFFRAGLKLIRQGTPGPRALGARDEMRDTQGARPSAGAAVRLARRGASPSGPRRR